MAKIVEWVCCEDQNLTDYWHENDNCGDEMCYAEECDSCGEWETLCGTTSKEK